MNCDEAERLLLSLGPGKSDHNLERLKNTFEKAGIASPKYPIVLVGGTNGKGSVIAITESLIKDCAKVGSFIKPHIFTLRERIRIGGKAINEVTFCEATQRLFFHLKLKGTTLTFYEATLALALLAFQLEGVDIGLIEVGLGGRFDACNVLPRILTVVTSLSMDHEELLGNYLSEIAFEKAGIFRKDVGAILSRACFTASENAELQATSAVSGNSKVAGLVLTRIAKLKGAKTIPIVVDAERLTGTLASGEQVFGIHPCEEQTPLSLKLPSKITLNLLGTYQRWNLECAITICNSLKMRLSCMESINVPENITVNYRGRFEVHRLGRGMVILDSAHNEEGFRALNECLSAYFPEDARFIVVFGCQLSKNPRALLQRIRQWAREGVPIFLPILHPTPKEDIAKAMRDCFIEPILVDADFEEQMRAVRQMCVEGQNVLVCGSIYYLGEVMKALLDEGKASSIFCG